MALKDMKSDLSKFRMPKKEPLQSKERTDIKKNQNQTPLSSMVESAPKIPRSQTTTNKEGVNPQKVNQSEKFKGETTPQPMDNSEKFKGETTPKPMSLVERYLGQTDPTKVDQTEKFKGETSPTQMNNESNFLGETSPKEMNNSEQFLGETTPKEMNNSENFLGETTPKSMDNSENFLGETTPKEMNNSENFLGETTPKSMNNSEQFLGETTPSSMDNESKFLGETTPSEMNNSEQFLGETTPSEMNNQSNFLGETTPTEMDNSRNFLGETTPSLFSQSPKLENEGKDFKEVNNLLDIHSTGFNSKFGGVEASKFVGVNPNNTVFDGTTSLFGDINNNSFTLGKTYGSSYNDVGGINSGEDGFGIGMGQAKRQSPSFLDEQYNKFNLKEDSVNTGLGLFRHPLILRGIQRKGLSKGEPQVWGIGGFSYDEGLIRGGAVTSTVRALVDVARIGAWAASVEGLLWGVKQVGLQRSQKFGKAWTPAGLLAAVGGQHIGLKAQRPGLIPLADETFKYKKAVLAGYKDKLSNIYNLTYNLPIGTPIEGDIRGGFNSVYGIGVTTIRKTEFTIPEGVRELLSYGPFSTNLKTYLGKLVIPAGIFGKEGSTPTDYNRESQLLPLGESKKALRKLFQISKKLGDGINYSLYRPTFQETNTDPFNTTKDKKNDIAGAIYKYDSRYDSVNFEDEGREEGDGNDLEKIYKKTSEKPDEEGTLLNKSETHTKYLDKRKRNSTETTGTEVAGKTYNDEESYPTSIEGRDEIVGTDLETAYKNVVDGNNVLDSKEIHKSSDSPFTKKIKTDGETHNIEKLNTSDTVKHYETLAYGNIPTRGATDTQFNDFRSLLTGNQKKLAELSNYKENNLEKKSGFNNPAQTTGQDRTKLFDTTPSSANTRWDVVNALRPQDSESSLEDDLVKFYIQPLGQKDGKFYQFRGTINGLTETFSPSWDSIKFSGRADQGYKYGSFERSVTFNFQMWATSRIEMKPMYEKLESLSTFTMPEYQGDLGYQGILVKFTLGDLYSNKLSFIESLTYTFSDDAPWDVNLDGSDLGVRPMGIDIAIGFKVLDETRPEYEGKVYDLGWR